LNAWCYQLEIQLAIADDCFSSSHYLLGSFEFEDATANRSQREGRYIMDSSLTRVFSVMRHFDFTQENCTFSAELTNNNDNEFGMERS
jgi:hypothetical protein